MDVVASISDRMGDLGGYLREQREHARLSVRQLASLAGVSNPYLSQVERGLRRPSAEVLQQIARGLRISAEALYVRAGILDEEGRPSVEAAVHADPDLNERQRRVLLDIYASFRAENRRAAEEEPEPERVVVRRRTPSGASRRAAAPADGAPVGEAPADGSPLDEVPAPVQPDGEEPDAVRPSVAGRPQRATKKAATATKAVTPRKSATAKKSATKAATAKRPAAARRASTEPAAEPATTEQATDDRAPATEGGSPAGQS